MSLNAIFLLLSSLEWFNLHFFMCPHAHMLSKTSILKLKFDFSILKSKLHFVIEAIFQNGSLILNSKLHFEIEALFCNRSSILKSKLHFEIKIDFKIKAPCWNRSSIFWYGKMYWFPVKKCRCWQNSRVSHMIHTFFGSSLGKV